MIDLRDFGLPESPRSREKQLYVRKGRIKFWLGLWMRFFWIMGM